MATTLEKEGRITFTASEDFIKSVKAYAVSRGKNIKSFFMRKRNIYMFAKIIFFKFYSILFC